MRHPAYNKPPANRKRRWILIAVFLASAASFGVVLWGIIYGFFGVIAGVIGLGLLPVVPGQIHAGMEKTSAMADLYILAGGIGGFFFLGLWLVLIFTLKK